MTAESVDEIRKLPLLDDCRTAACIGGLVCRLATSQEIARVAEIYDLSAYDDYRHRQRFILKGAFERLELIVHLTNESKLERARTAIRNFVADQLKTRDEKDAALVAFVSPTERQWRFSYVKMEYEMVPFFRTAVLLRI